MGVDTNLARDKENKSKRQREDDLVVFLIMSSVFLDIVNVVILPCAFCIQMQILYNAQLVGELSYFL